MRRFSACCLPALALAFGVFGSPPAAHAQRSTFAQPTGYWSFDLCETASPLRTWDSARTPHHASLLNGAACSSTGRYGSSGYFDGVDDRAEVASSVDFNLANQMSIAAWVYPTRLIGTQTIANRWYGGDSWLLALSGTSFSFTVVVPGGYKTVTYPAAVNTWQHVAGVYDGVNVLLYVNGALRASLAASGNVAATARPIVIGNNPSWNAYQGYIDEVKLYKTALSTGQVGALATNPVSVGTRGLHLFPSSYVCDPVAFPGWCRASNWGQFQKDLDYIHSIGNLNSMKTSLFSYRSDPNASFWLARQQDKLSWIHSATGNHVTHIFRAWPQMCGAGEACDCAGNLGQRDYFNCGYTFAQNLSSSFAHIQNTLKLRDVYIEVGNEPNLPGEGFVDGSGNASSAAYNDFFRGFFYGQQSVGYNFPLTYAGLSPGCTPGGGCTADAWYQDYWVRDHIKNYASKIGVHVYWNSLSPTQNSSGRSGRLVEQGGLFYRRVKNLLASAVPARGIQITEFNLNRNQIATTEQQAADFCEWWKQEAADALAGWWVEQATLFVTDLEDPDDDGIDDRPYRNEYIMADDQLDNIRFCQ